MWFAIMKYTCKLNCRFFFYREEDLGGCLIRPSKFDQGVQGAKLSIFFLVFFVEILKSKTKP